MAQTGILQRRGLKADLITNPPIDGEIVYATDTDEHGWVKNGVLYWKLMDKFQPILTVLSPPSGNENDTAGTVYLVVEGIVSIAVTPVNGVIHTTLSTAQTVQYTATATWGDGSTSDITSVVSWINNDTTNVNITLNGLASYNFQGTTYVNTVRVTATLDGLSGSTDLELIS